MDEIDQFHPGIASGRAKMTGIEPFRLENAPDSVGATI